MTEQKLSAFIRRDRLFHWLWLLGGAATFCYAVISCLSFRFRFDAGHADRPLLQILALFTIAGACWLTAVFLVLKRGKAEEHPLSKKLLIVVLAFAGLHRLVLLPSQPIQEIDFYRYLWDGRVLAAGHNPFRFSPKQIDDWKAAGADRGERQAIHQLAASSESFETIFARVHHRHVPTVYPPLAQVIFATTSLLTPAHAPLWLHILILKLVLIAFDIGTLVVLIHTLRLLNLPMIWSLAYGWCPLVLKEIANSAHLDSIAVFCTAFALFVLVYLWKKIAAINGPLQLLYASLSASCLGLGVLAKSYPVVLLPVVAGFLASRLRWRVAVPLAAFFLVLILGYARFAQFPSTTENAGANSSSAVRTDANKSAPAAAGASNSPLTGLAKFLTYWEMNDFLFMLVRENLRVPYTAADRWFVVVPRQTRQGIDRAATPIFASLGLAIDEFDSAFLIAQGIMGSIVAGLSCWLGYRLWRRPDPKQALKAVFLVLVWSWLLSAASNPWYLLWCLPFIVFAEKRSWFLLPVFAFLYYIRFWMQYQVWPNIESAVEVFDYHLIWLEFLPFFLLLIAETYWRSQTVASSAASSDTLDRVSKRQAKGELAEPRKSASVSGRRKSA